MSRRPRTRNQDRAGIGGNGGPPLEEPPHEPEWGKGEIDRYFEWRSAHRRAWRKPPAIALRRQERAEELGLTYEEYTLELLERGRYPQPEDVAAIKAKRGERRKAGGVVGQSLKGLRLR
ncbi:hypothetical protein [Bosea sp. PAMC 26642]|uniref:hypothetical protein n=1 Tax=Bosea sp. (strain PAMC 26642) TaxID=1792307 RepID=UPI0007705104|nr:hypothetical protein [Bosea sp. PAMC 26642]AMJ60882.1 hypothetical protein AXW83_11760 [Bosea sp. PAMC 26642]